MGVHVHEPQPVTGRAAGSGACPRVYGVTMSDVDQTLTERYAAPPAVAPTACSSPWSPSWRWSALGWVAWAASCRRPRKVESELRRLGRRRRPPRDGVRAASRSTTPSSHPRVHGAGAGRRPLDRRRADLPPHQGTNQRDGPHRARGDRGRRTGLHRRRSGPTPLTSTPKGGLTCTFVGSRAPLLVDFRLLAAPRRRNQRRRSDPVATPSTDTRRTHAPGGESA